MAFMNRYPHKFVQFVQPKAVLNVTLTIFACHATQFKEILT